MDRPNAVPVINFETKTKPRARVEGDLRAKLHCPLFGCPFVTRFYLQFDTHVESIHLCAACGFYVARKDLHRCSTPGQMGGHVDVGRRLDESFFRESSRSVRGTMKTYIHAYDDEATKSAIQAFNDAKPSIVHLFDQLMELHGNLLVSFGLNILMTRDEIDENGTPKTVFQNFYFHSNKLELFDEGDMDNIVTLAATQVQNNIEVFVKNGSGWRVHHVVAMEMSIAELQMYSSARPKGYIPMPFRKQGVINFRNQDDDCFKYSICCAVYLNELKLDNEMQPKFHKKKPSNHFTWKKYFEKFEWAAIKGGVQLYGNLQDFEVCNNIRVNVFSHKPDKSIVLVRKSREQGERVANLFLIHEDPSSKAPGAKTHFAVITDLSAFFGHLNKGHKKLFCIHCLRVFSSQKTCSHHETICPDNPRPALKFPKPGKVLKFGRFDMSLMSTINIYYDFECLSVPVNERKGVNTVVHTEYKPASFALAIVYNSGLGLDLVDCEYHHAGEETVKLFFQRVFHHAKKILTYIRATNRSIKPTADEVEKYRLAKECMYCTEKFTEGFGISYANQDDGDEDDEIYSMDDEELDMLFRDDNYEEFEYNSSTSGPAPEARRIQKVWHHQHQDGSWLGPTCDRCNRYQRANHTVNVIGMNSTRFDNHLLVAGFSCGLFAPENVRVIARSAQEYVEIEIALNDTVPRVGKSNVKVQTKASCGNRKVKVRFIDCLNFLVGSLSAQVDTLRAENNPNFSLVKDAFRFMTNPGCGIEVGRKKAVVNLEFFEGFEQTASSVSEDDCNVVVNNTAVEFTNEPTPLNNVRPTKENIDLLLQKLPYAYSYLDSFEKLKYDTPMPSRNFYNNKLTGEDCTDEDWEKIQEISKRFKIDNFGAWTKMYNVSDTILLAIVMETYRTKAYEKFKLDPLATCTNSSYSWSCFLKSTGVELEYIRDPEIVEMLESCKRGGVAGCSKKLCTANRDDMPDYNPELPTTHIASCDLNSLYGHSMCFPLPQKDFQLIDPSTLEGIDWAEDGIGEKLGYGFILTVDLLYTKDAQNISMDIPFAPEKLTPRYSELSKGQQNMVDSLGPRGKSFITQPKLILSHYDRCKYTVHYRELALYLQLGMKLEKIHKALRFIESNYMESYIKFNLKCRSESKSPSESSYYKILSNGCYGRSLMSSKKMIEVKFSSTRTQTLLLLSSPFLKSFKTMSPDLAMLVFHPKEPVFCYPIATGVSILGISKYIFYNGIYNQLKKIFGPTLVCQCWDTDGVVVNYTETEPGKFYRSIVENRHLFDFSKLPKTHKLFQDYSNISDLKDCGKSVPGLWKLESLDISEAVSVKAKNYSLKYFSGKSENRLKGVNHSAKRQCEHLDFLKVVKDPSYQVKVKVQQIRSYTHTLLGIQIDKMALHNLDVSRVYPTDDINLSYPFGCHKLEQYE